MKNPFKLLAIMATTFWCISLGFLYLPAQDLDINFSATSQAEYIHHNDSASLVDGLLSIGIDNDPFTSAANWGYCRDDAECGASGEAFFNFADASSRTIEVFDTTSGSTNFIRIRQETASSRELLIEQGSTEVTGVYYVKLSVAISGVRRYREYFLAIRQPFELVFVLDRSGSMECGPTGNSETNWTGCIEECAESDHINCTDRRWDKLKEALESFLAQIPDESQLEEDSVSVVYFSGSLSSLADPGPLVDLSARNFGTVQDFGNTTSGIRRNMSDPPRENNATRHSLAIDGTSIGAGLAEALMHRFGGTGNPHRRQAVFLFTDGEQNQPPMVVTTAASRIIDDVQFPGDPGPPVDIDLNQDDGDAVPDDLNDIELYTIGANSVLPGNPTTLLEQLASAGDTDFLPDPMDASNSDFLVNFSNSAFNEFWEDFSPNLLGFADLEVDSRNEASFHCNKGVSRLVFKAQFRDALARRYRYTVIKDDVTVAQFTSYYMPDSDSIRARVGNYYASLTLHFNKLDSLESEGGWTFICEEMQGDGVVLRSRPDNQEIGGVATMNQLVLGSFFKNLKNNELPTMITEDIDISLRLSATADDPALHMDCQAGERGQAVDNPMPLAVRLYRHTRPIPGAQIKAYILKPGDDLNDLLAREDFPSGVGLNTDPEAGGCYTQRFTYLQLNHPEVLESLRDAGVRGVDLSYHDGVYTGSYDDANVTGVYKVIFTIDVELPGVGRIERAAEQTVNVRFDEVDMALTETEVDPYDNGLILTIRPVHRVGGQTRFIGPGLGYGYGVSGAELTGVNDNCDGSYELYLNTQEENPDIRIHLLDDEFYSGRANDFNKPYYKYPGGISLHGGITYPIGDLDTLYDGNYFAEADFGYQFHPYFSLEGAAGYYSFTNDFNILGASLYAKGQFTLSQANLFAALAAGGGYYFPKQEASSAGFNLRASVIRRFNMRWDISLEAAYFQMLQAGEYSWGTLGAGVKYRF